MSRLMEAPHQSTTVMADVTPSSSLYVIGGQQRSPRPLRLNDENWYEYHKGLILRVDPVRGVAEPCFEYRSRPEATGPDDPVLFKSATVEGDRLYACTQTEVMVYALPQFELLTYISLPCFNDVHHVRLSLDGHLLVANSGLEMVLEVTHQGEVLRMWNVLGEEPWEHFSQTVDYRHGINLKPHRAHPNHLFYVGEDIWVTRFEQRDAIALTGANSRLHIGLERVHDGVVHNGLVYFTTVDGKVVIGNPHTQRVEEVIDLTAMHDEDTLLGWCRGLLVEGDRAWVGFSRIRPTRFRERVSWVRQGFKHAMPTHIAYYDLVRQRCLAEFEVESYGLNALFTIAPG